MEYRKITMRDMSNAVNRAAWWLRANLGESTNFETLSYMGPADIRYGIFFIAAIKAGYKVLVVPHFVETIADQRSDSFWCLQHVIRCLAMCLCLQPVSAQK
jgi:acyl-coenzyme A synthetase/AMP-(fatty) acid ligase